MMEVAETIESLTERLERMEAEDLAQRIRLADAEVMAVCAKYQLKLKAKLEMVDGQIKLDPVWIDAKQRRSK